jgi:hypothetical protein
LRLVLSEEIAGFFVLLRVKSKFFSKFQVANLCSDTETCKALTTTHLNKCVVVSALQERVFRKEDRFGRSCPRAILLDAQ